MRIGKVVFEKKGYIATITLDDPGQLNALGKGIIEGLVGSFAEAEKDDEVRVVVITGSGRAFCAGADIKDQTNLEYLPNARNYMIEMLKVQTLGEKASKPVIAAVNGFCLGGGLEVALGCDFIFASSEAQFGVPEIKLGLLPGFGQIRLCQIVGRARAKRLVMTGDRISAEEAMRIGLVDSIVPHEKLMEEALAFAGKIASMPPVTIRFAKAVLNRELGGEELAYIRDASAYLFGIEDAKEGIRAFLEKRKPIFKGR